MTHYQCRCSYLGTKYYGWQSQVGGNTIQDIIEERLSSIFKRSIRIHGAGRTDSGVHARGQCFHFDAYWQESLEKLQLAIHSKGFPDDISIDSIQVVPESFHCRFSALKKRYIYQIHLGRAHPFEHKLYWSLPLRTLNIKATQEAAQALSGKYDFTAFAALRGDGLEVGENPVKTIDYWKVERQGKSLKITTEGSGYLYKMVRSVVGTLVQVAQNKISPKELAEILKNKQRTQTVVTAPAQGLILDHVFYPDFNN